MTLKERVKAPTPKFFKRVGKWGLRALGVAGLAATAVLAAPVALPAIVLKVAGYVATAGIVAKAVSSAAVDEEALENGENQ